MIRSSSLPYGNLLTRIFTNFKVPFDYEDRVTQSVPVMSANSLKSLCFYKTATRGWKNASEVTSVEATKSHSLSNLPCLPYGIVLRAEGRIMLSCALRWTWYILTWGCLARSWMNSFVWHVRYTMVPGLLSPSPLQIWIVLPMLLIASSIPPPLIPTSFRSWFPLPFAFVYYCFLFWFGFIPHVWTYILLTPPPPSLMKAKGGGCFGTMIKWCMGKCCKLPGIAPQVMYCIFLKVLRNPT